MSAEDKAPPAPETPRRKSWIAFLPVILFVALAAVFLIQLERGGGSSVVPSALIGAPAPQQSLPPLDGLAANGSAVPGWSTADLAGRVSLVNVFASWCVPCREEHPMLMELARDERLHIVGLNYKDEGENALRFLGQLGNPYDAVGVDRAGKFAIDWGVYGVPETFVVGPDGRIAFKHVGPLTDEVIRASIMPLVESLGQ